MPSELSVDYRLDGSGWHLQDGCRRQRDARLTLETVRNGAARNDGARIQTDERRTPRARASTARMNP
jgi:hypothetical protein